MGSVIPTLDPVPSVSVMPSYPVSAQTEVGTTDNSSVVVNQSFNFSANGDDSVKKLIAQAAPQIAKMTKSEIINDRKRGGSMKAVFG